MGSLTYLLDTCALLWWWSTPERLSARALALIKDPENRYLVSSASAWEVATKFRIGKYPEGAQVIKDWENRLLEDGFEELPIGFKHGLKAGTLPGDHRDPFDRMLAAQALLADLTILTCDPEIEGLGAKTAW